MDIMNREKKRNYNFKVKLVSSSENYSYKYYQQKDFFSQKNYTHAIQCTDKTDV